MTKKIIYKRIITFINKCDTLAKNQYGFRKNKSTKYALTLISNVISEMNRQIASAPEKSEADFYARRSRGHDIELYTRHLIGYWNVYTARRGEAGEDGSATRCTCTERCVCWKGPTRCALAVSVYFSRSNLTRAKWSDNRCSVEHFYYKRKLTDVLTQNYQTKILNHNPSPKGGR